VTKIIVPSVTVIIGNLM